MKPLLSLLISSLFVTVVHAQTITANGPTAFCDGGQVVLKASAGDSYQWLLDGNPNGATGQSYTAKTSGKYSVIITTSGKKDTTAAVTVTVNPNPTANFKFTDDQCSSSPYQFTDQSTGTGLQYAWDFGDPASGNNTSGAANPVHRFAGNDQGNQSFNVKLTVTTGPGCSDNTTKQVNVKKPNTHLDGTGAVQFNNQDYFAQCYTVPSDFDFTYSGSGNSHYRIIWGDGKPDYNAGTFNSPSHNYAVGIYTMKFIVTGGGCTDTSSYKVFVGSNPGGSISNPSSTQGCTGQQFLLPFANTKDNPLGTIYNVSVNDGTPADIYFQPAPADYAHTFNKTSCGTGTNNFFTVSYTISNPCGIVPGSISGIGISDKPSAAFKLSKDTACVNTDVLLDNQSSAVSIVSSLGVCSNGKDVWKISPANGWTVTGGNMGDDKGGNNTNSWVGAADPVNVRFTAPGKYTVKLKLAGSAACGVDSITKEICVNPVPTASFSFNKTTGCAPLAASVSTTTNNPACGVWAYQWHIDYAPASGCSPSDGTVNYTGGTTEHSREPSFSFTSPGTYYISVTLTSPNGGCAYTTPQQTITVTGKPVVGGVSIPGTICQGSNVSPSATATCNMAGATWSWNFGSGLPATSTQQVPGQVSFGTAGGTTISVAVTNSCGITTATKQVTVSPVPTAVTPKDSTYCAGSKTGSFHFSSSQPAASITWSNSNPSIGLASAGSGDIPAFTAVNNSSVPVTAVITVSASLNGCGSDNSFTITVNPRPGLPGVVTPVHYCQGDAATALTATPAAGNTLFWYNQSTGGTGNKNAPVPSTGQVGSADFYVSQQNSFGCESGRSDITVNVDAVPVTSLAGSGNPTACATATGNITLKGLNNGTAYTVSYTKNGAPVVSTISSSNTGQLVIGNLAAGVYDKISVTLNGCPSAPLGPVTLTDPNPPAAPVAGADGPLCSGGNLHLTATPSATGTISFNWTGPGGFTSNQQNPVLTNVPITANGTYFVTNTVNNCTSPAASVKVLVNETPVTPQVGSNSPVCSGSDILLTAGSYPYDVVYAWNGPGFTDNTQNPVIHNASVLMSANYSLVVTPKAYHCPSASAAVKVLVNQTPQITNATAVNPNNCGTSTGHIVLEGLTPAKTYQVQYTNPQATVINISLAADASGNITIPNLSSGTYTGISVSSSNCPSNTKGPLTLSDPTPPQAPKPTANGPVCSGNTLQLTANPAVAGAATFHWTGPNGYTSDQQDPSFPAGVNAGGTYFVTTTIDNCTSPAGQVQVVVNPTPAKPVLSGNSPLCEHETLTLNAQAYTGVTYAWTGPNSFTTAAPAVSINNAAPAMSGIYSLVVTSDKNCPSPTGNVNITVHQQPIIGNTSFANPLNCGSASGSITLSGLEANTVYAVSYTSAGQQTKNITADAAGNVIITGLVSGMYSNITVSLNNCPSPAAGPFTLTDPNPPAAPVAASNGPVCTGTILNLSATSAVPDGTYSWTGPNGFTANSQNPAISNVTLAANGDYLVTVTTHACTSQAGIITVVVNEVPETPKAISNSPVCNNGTLSLMASTPTQGAITYQWTGPGGFTSSQQAPQVSPVSASQAGTYTVTATNAGCISKGAASLDVVIKPTAEIASVSKADPTSCGSFTGSITLEHFDAITPYFLQYAYNGGTAATVPVNTNPAGAIVLTGLPAGIYSDIKVVLDGCPSQPAGPVTLTDLPPLVPSAGSNGPLCEGSTLRLSASAATADNVQYLWVGPGGFTSNDQNPVIPVTTAANNGVYAVKATVNGCSASASVNVVVSATSVGGITGNDTTVCTGTNAGIISLSGQTGSVIRWESAPLTGGPWALLNNTTSSQTFQNLSSTTYYRAVVKNGVCPETNSGLTKINVINSVGVVNAGPDQLICNQNAVTLSGSVPVVGTGNWTQVSGPAVTINPPNDVHPAVTGLAPGNTYGFRWQVVGPPGCGSAADAVVVTNRPAVTQATAGADQGICDFPGTSNVNITANATVSPYEVARWSVISQPPGGSGTFGDAAKPATVFAVAVPGLYTLQWKISDDTAGCVPSTATLMVDVRPKPKAAFAVNTVKLCEGQDVTVINHSVNASTFTWLWGDGTAAGFTGGQHTYSRPADYTITLVASEKVFNASCSDTARSPVVHVGELPGASIDVSPAVILVQPKRSFDFSDISATSPEKAWLWKMGDASSQTRSGQSISYTYADTGSYFVQLLTTDNTTGCTSTDTLTVTVQFVPGYLQVPDAICPGCAAGGLRAFLPLAKGLSYYHLRIYNTWGKLVFESTALNADGSPKEPWNAQYNKTATVQQNVYRWEIEARFVNGTEWKGMQYPNYGKPVKSGFITVIK